MEYPKTGATTNLKRSPKITSADFQYKYPEDDMIISIGLNLRKVSSDYFGPCVRVRRGSDNYEQDISFGIDNQVDWKGLQDFSLGGDVFVTTVYYQGRSDPTDRNLVQTTTTKQPKIVESGVIVNQNGKVGLKFDGVDDELVTTIDSYFDTESVTGYCLLGQYTNKAIGDVFGNRNLSTGWICLLRNVSATTVDIRFINLGFNQNQINPFTKADHTLIWFSKESSISRDWNVFYNNIQGTDSGANGYNLTTDVFHIGRAGVAYATNEYYEGIIFEFNAWSHSNTQSGLFMYNQHDEYKWWLKDYYGITAY